ncbi:MAG: VOC family protein [Nitriliruptorales bacterium]|nr:VOC family protein [Nitriliruptorales bacterium]
MARIGYVTIDCDDVDAQMTFWSQALGYNRADGPWSLLRDPDEEGVTLYFQSVPESKVAKNRVHLDLVAADPSVEVERLTGLGASRLRDVEEGGLAWTVLEDPEGNEFCVFPAGPSPDG